MKNEELGLRASGRQGADQKWKNLRILEIVRGDFRDGRPEETGENRAKLLTILDTPIHLSFRQGQLYIPCISIYYL